MTGSSSMSDCIQCMAGKYSSSVGAAAASTCIDCVAGKYVDVAGSDAAADCIDCVAGKYVEADDSCDALGIGFYGCGGHCIPKCPHFGAAWNDGGPILLASMGLNLSKFLSPTSEFQRAK